MSASSVCASYVCFLCVCSLGALPLGASPVSLISLLIRPTYWQPRLTTDLILSVVNSMEPVCKHTGSHDHI